MNPNTDAMTPLERYELAVSDFLAAQKRMYLAYDELSHDEMEAVRIARGGKH
jgi:hypothetical protein